jgi:plastocyanin
MLHPHTYSVFLNKEQSVETLFALCCIMKVFMIRFYSMIQRRRKSGGAMRRSRQYKSPLCLPALFGSWPFFFLISTLLCSVAFLFILSPTAFSQGIITVQINGLAQAPGFTPALLTLHVNETVLFINHALPAQSYTLHADDGSFSSPAIPSGGSWAITFRTPGSHTYRDSANAQTMVGELLVVEKSVSLLATPNPFVEATVTTLIKNGQNPPDTIIIATPKRPIPPANSLIPLIILVVGITISVTLLSIFGINFYKRYRQRLAVNAAKEDDEDVIPDIKDDDDDVIPDIEDDDDDTDSHTRIQQIHAIMDNLKQKIQVRSHLLRRKRDDEDDEDDDDD